MFSGEEDIHSTMSSEFIIADIDQDGLDEILISTSTISVTISRILKSAGRWRMGDPIHLSRYQLAL